MYTPTLLGCQREETNGLHPRNGREGIVEVDSLLLDEPACHQTHLVLDHCPGLILLDLVDPLKGDRGVPCRVSLRPSEGAGLAVLVRKVQLHLKVVNHQYRDGLSHGTH